MKHNHNVKILIVDDQPGMRQTLMDILEDYGYCIDSAPDGLTKPFNPSKLLDIIAGLCEEKEEI